MLNTLFSSGIHIKDGIEEVKNPEESIWIDSFEGITVQRKTSQIKSPDSEIHAT